MKISLKKLPQLLISVLIFQATWCQSKLKVTTDDYKKWHTLSLANISGDGLWSSYKLEYEKGIDTIMIQEIQSRKMLSFPQATTATFSPDNKLVLINYADNSMEIHNLQDHSTVKIDSVVKYAFAANGKWLAISQNCVVKKQVLIYDTNGKLLSIMKNVADFEWSIEGKIAVVESTGLTIYDPAQNFIKSKVPLDSTWRVKNLVWNKFGNILAFLRETDNNGYLEVFAYNLPKKKLYSLDYKILGKNQLTDYIQTPIILSEDGTQLFFFYKSISSNVVNDNLVEKWDSASKLVYPAQKIYGNPALKPKIAVWNMVNNSVKLLATNEFPNSFLTKDYKHVLTYSHLTNEPQYEMIAPVDLHISNIQSGEKKLLLSKQSISGYSIGCSPSGRYINYFKDKNWWLYDTRNKKQINLTENLNVSFDNMVFDEPRKSEGFGCPGWTTDSKYIILYDTYDIWLVTPDLKTVQRITQGAEQKIKFRIAENIYSQSNLLYSSHFSGNTFNLSHGLFLASIGGDQSSGYYKWSADGSINEIVYGPYKYSSLRKSSNGDAVVFVKENYETPPSVCYWTQQQSNTNELFQSNSHASRYEWGTSKIITFKNKDGELLQGALFFPSGYESGKRYPMVVYIYSKLSSLLYEYNNPTMYNVAGFAHSNYVADGYLVLFPDIHYKVGNPAVSILDSVKSAVNTVIDMGVADEKRIGLIGHSFGGFETCLLLTRTPMFKAAVAGASVTDLVSSYLTVNTKNGVKMDWRFESQQYRMGSTPFENLNGYLENSTVVNAEKITTPLLSWAGQNDSQVDWKQSIELHLALRRLKKRNIFLAYPNEGHILANPEAQFDLSSRIKNWFDYYLKDKPLPNDTGY